MATLLSAAVRVPLLPMKSLLVLAIALAQSQQPCHALHQGRVLDRRQAISAAGAAVVASVLVTSPHDDALAAALEEDVPYAYEARNRNGNKQALIREDYWYMIGKTPPRKLDSLEPDNPKWNVWGACESTSTGGNPCTYVPLKQRIPAYSKYAFNIALGAKEYQQVGKILQQLANKNDNDTSSWNRAATMLNVDQSPPPPAVDALLKMVLFASAMLTTPNYSGPPRDLLVARFYVNEADFATRQVYKAIEEKDVNRALNAWEFGKDSWNSYLNIVNRGIVPKVGDPIPLIE